MQFLGLPWKLVEPTLIESSIPYIVIYGKSYNRFFDVSTEGYYVTRIALKGKVWEILLYRPMINSGFDKCKEVQYVSFTVQEEK